MSDPATPDAAPAIDLDRLRGLEAVLFLADHPLDLDTLGTALDCAPAASSRCWPSSWTTWRSSPCLA